jgi:SNF2 family DNA or RNA helicase
MSGTPVANRPYDLISQLAFLGKNKQFKNYTKSQLDLPRNNIESNFSTLENRISELKAKIDEISFTYTKESLLKNGNIVKKTEQTLLFNLSKKQQHDYINILPSNLELARQDKNKRNAWIIQTIAKLVQVCSETRKTINEEKSEKEKYLLCEAARCKKRGESFIIWTSFVNTCDRLACILKDYNVYKVHGKISQDSRIKAITGFKRSKCSVLVATMQSCKEGLNLQNAVRCFFYDPALRLDDILQAQDRIHRINQKRPVFVYYLIYKNTIEQWIHKLHELKRHFSIDIFNNSQKLNAKYIFDSSNSLRGYLK